MKSKLPQYADFGDPPDNIGEMAESTCGRPTKRSDCTVHEVLVGMCGTPHQTVHVPNAYSVSIVDVGIEDDTLSGSDFHSCCELNWKCVLTAVGVRKSKRWKHRTCPFNRW